MKCRPAHTAPRDGTIIIGLFERQGQRRIAVAAAYDMDAFTEEPPPTAAPLWVHESWQGHVDRLANDPTWFFKPLSDEVSYGRMTGWRPAAPSHHRS